MPRFACVVIVDPRGRLLLQERDEHPRIDPETWGLCGGHVEEGEDVEAAAYRELAEETELAPPPGTLRHWRELSVFHETYGTTDPVHVYVGGLAVTDTDITCHEGRQIVFVEPDAVAGLPLSQTAGHALPALIGSPEHARLREEAAARA